MWKLTSKEAQERIPDYNADWLRTNQAFYQGDHWQKGDGWVGPTLPGGRRKTRRYAGSVTRRLSQQLDNGLFYGRTTCGAHRSGKCVTDSAIAAKEAVFVR